MRVDADCCGARRQRSKRRGDIPKTVGNAPTIGSLPMAPNGSVTLTNFFAHRPDRASPHPAVTASFLLLASLWCLVAFAPQGITEAGSR